MAAMSGKLLSCPWRCIFSGLSRFASATPNTTPASFKRTPVTFPIHYSVFAFPQSQTKLQIFKSASTFSALQHHLKPKPASGLGAFATGVRYLPTLNQIRRQKPRSKNTQLLKYIPREERVMLGPQRKGVCIKVFIRKPKKPNSAQRKCALLKLNNGKTISAYIPGERGQLQEHGVVIFEGGRVQDCPGIKYKIIRRKLDMN